MDTSLPFTREQAEAWRETWPTPFYVYDAAAITARVEALQRAFAWNPGFKEYFAVKATPTPAILRLLREMGCGVDCASVAELAMAERCGFSDSEVMFTSNETRPFEYEAACDLGAIVNLDDLTQVDVLEEACGVPDTVCCRYNPGSFAISNDIMGHLDDSKFGMPRDQLFEAYRRLRDLGARHFGVHAMLASCSLDEGYYPALARELFTLVLDVRRELGIELEFVDMAGGIGVPYRPEEDEVDIQAIGAGVRDVYNELIAPADMAVAVCCELGRWVTGPAGYLVTSVTGHKHTYREYVGVDASAADLMRPAMYGAYHHVTVLGKEADKSAGPVDVAGPLCENNDKLAVQRELPATEVGDLLVVHTTGAHGRSMGYNYNGRPRCGELLLMDDGSVRQVRRAETTADLFATLDVDEEFSGGLS